MDAPVLPAYRGRTLYGSNTIPASTAWDPTGVEGQVRVFNDRDAFTPPTAGEYTPGLAKPRTQGGREVICIFVRNNSGVTLYPGRAVAWDPAARGRRVIGYTNTTAQEVAGIVDEYLTWANGVRNGDCFWLVVKGHCVIPQPEAQASFADSWAAGDILYALTHGAGSTAAQSAVATSEAGRLTRWATTFSATQTTDGTAARIVMNRVARVVSAISSARSSQVVTSPIMMTTGGVLVDVDCWR